MAVGRRHWRWPVRRSRLAQALPTDRSELAYSYAPLVKRVSPAVVNIYTTTTASVQRRLPFPFPACRRRGERVQNFAGLGRAGAARRADRHQRPCREGRRRDPRRAGRPARVRRQARHPGRALRPRPAAHRRQRREVPLPRDARFGLDRGRRHRAGDRQSVRPQPDRDQRHHLGAGAHAPAASTIRASSSRPTPPSIPAIPAARWSASTGG